MVFIFIFSISSAFAEDKQDPLVSKQKYEWVVEEILQQLTELRKEVSSMNKDIIALNDKFDASAKTVQRSGITVPTIVELGSNIMGDQDASFAIVEFSDYQCPYCGRHANNVLSQTKKEGSSGKFAGKEI